MSDKVRRFTGSVFSEFTALCSAHRAVNLGQGFPDWPAPRFVKEAGERAIREDHNQYSRSMGHPVLVQVLADTYKHKMPRLDPMKNVVVTAGATEGMLAALMAIVSHGDEVVIVQPHYDAYPAQVKMAGGVPKFVSLRPQGEGRSASHWKLDVEELKASINSKTRAIIINTPHNPLGKVFSKKELEDISEVVLAHKDLYVISDEVYEWIVFGDAKHESIASIEGMWDRTITISSAGKTFSCTGWKVGWTFANGKAMLLKL
jgi:aspartate/methionine/tyrosine aminotransferase